MEDGLDAGAITEFDLAGDHHLITGGHSLADHYPAIPALTGFD